MNQPSAKQWHTERKREARRGQTQQNKNYELDIYDSVSLLPFMCAILFGLRVYNSHKINS